MRASSRKEALNLLDKIVPDVPPLQQDDLPEIKTFYREAMTSFLLRSTQQETSVLVCACPACPVARQMVLGACPALPS